MTSHDVSGLRVWECFDEVVPCRFLKRSKDQDPQVLAGADPELEVLFADGSLEGLQAGALVNFLWGPSQGSWRVLRMWEIVSSGTGAMVPLQLSPALCPAYHPESLHLM